MRRVPLDLKQATGLALADGSTWSIAVGDASATFVVSRLIEAMQLRPGVSPSAPSVLNGAEPLLYGPARHLVVLVDCHKADWVVAVDAVPNVLAADAAVGPEHASPKPLVPASHTALPSEDEDPVVCILSPAKNDDIVTAQVMQVSLVIARHTQIRGGVLLHGALAQRDGYGVILAGPSEVGKTTASRRISRPWRSLCDDTTLIVRDEQGAYWAHPWPTWGDLMFGGPGGSWDVQHAVPLKGIFFLDQAPEDQVEPVGVGQAVCLLVESVEQASGLSLGMAKDELRALCLQRFNNICALAQVVPCYLLHLSLTGTFWQEIEKAIGEE